MKKYLSTISSVLGIIIVIGGWMWAFLSIKTDVALVKNDINYIKEDIQESKDNSSDLRQNFNNFKDGDFEVMKNLVENMAWISGINVDKVKMQVDKEGYQSDVTIKNANVLQD